MLLSCWCMKVNAVVVHQDTFVITGSDDGGVRMWSVNGHEQTLQFLVMNHVSLCANIVIYNRL